MKEEGLIKDTFELVIKEFQLILSLAYILMISIGMAFTYQKYIAFGINIFYYADVFDFLIAPFRDFKIIYLALISLLMPFLAYQLDLWFHRKFPKWYKFLSFGWHKYAWYSKFRLLTFSILCVTLVFSSALKFGKNSAHSIKQKVPVTVYFSNGEKINVIIIGKTKEVLFVLEKDMVRAIPIGAEIKSFDISRIKL